VDDEAMRFNLGANSNVSVFTNQITMTGLDLEGMQFTSVAGPSSVQINNNVIDLNGGLTNLFGIRFLTVTSGTLNLSGPLLNDVTINGQNYANAHGTCTFYNAVQSQSFTRNNCASGGTPSAVTYTVAGGTYNSLISQADANQQATNAILANGQNNANTNGTCTFYNTAKNQSFARNNCGAGGIGSSVSYNVAAGLYNSIISQADADQQAINVIAANGQNNANANGSCTYYNTVQSGNYTRNNCSCQFTGSVVTYTVAANTYSSSISLNDANQQALNYIAANGQANANAIGTCTTTCSGNDHKIVGCNCLIGTYGLISQSYANGKCTRNWGYFFSDGTTQFDHSVTGTGPCVQ